MLTNSYVSDTPLPSVAVFAFLAPANKLRWIDICCLADLIYDLIAMIPHLSRKSALSSPHRLPTEGRPFDHAVT